MGCKEQGVLPHHQRLADWNGMWAVVRTERRHSFTQRGVHGPAMPPTQLSAEELTKWCLRKEFTYLQELAHTELLMRLFL